MAMDDREGIVELIFCTCGSRLGMMEWMRSRLPPKVLTKSVEKVCMRVGRQEILPLVSLERLRILFSSIFGAEFQVDEKWMMNGAKGDWELLFSLTLGRCLRKANLGRRRKTKNHFLFFAISFLLQKYFVRKKIVNSWDFTLGQILLVRNLTTHGAGEFPPFTPLVWSPNIQVDRRHDTSAWSGWNAQVSR